MERNWVVDLSTLPADALFTAFIDLEPETLTGEVDCFILVEEPTEDGGTMVTADQVGWCGLEIMPDGDHNAMKREAERLMARGHWFIENDWQRIGRYYRATVVRGCEPDCKRHSPS